MESQTTAPTVEASTSKHETPQYDMCRARYGTFPECPLCGSDLTPEHAHFKCRSCGWRDSCCD